MIVMKPWLFAVFVVFVASAPWWNLSDQKDQHDAVIDNSPTSTKSVAEKRNTGAYETERLASEASNLETTKTSDDANRRRGVSIAEMSDTVQKPAADGDSNTAFAIVGDKPRETELLAQDEPSETAPETKTSAAVTQQESKSEPSAVGRINMPDSYPVTEAAKYYIPKEERKPGNLGGPPPLNFPGGPSDPN